MQGCCVKAHVKLLLTIHYRSLQSNENFG